MRSWSWRQSGWYRSLLVVLGLLACAPAEEGVSSQAAVRPSGPEIAPRTGREREAAVAPRSGDPAAGEDLELPLDVRPTSLLGAVRDVCESAAVQTQMAATVPAGLTQEQRAALVEARRHRLRTVLKQQALERSLEVEQELAPYVALGPGAVPAMASSMPGTCRYFEEHTPEAWSAARSRHAGLVRATDAFTRLADRLLATDQVNGVYGLLLDATYELVLLDFLVAGGWKDRRLWPEGVPVPDGGLPAIVPLDGIAGSTSFAQERIARLHARFPLLQRPVGGVLGVARESLGHWLFRTAFAVDQRRGEEIATRLVADIQPALDALHAEHAAMSEGALYEFMRAGGFELPPEAMPGSYDLAQRKHLLVWQRFLRERLPALRSARASQVVEQQPALAGPIRARLREVAAAWVAELGEVREQLCLEGDATVEEEPHLLALYLGRRRGPEVFELLDGYCHSDWGRTWDTVTDTLVRVAGYALVLGGIAFAPSSALALPWLTLPWNGVAATGSGLVWLSGARRALRHHRTLDLSSALYSPTVIERNWETAWTALDLSMLPVSMVLWGTVAGKLAAQTVPVRPDYIPVARLLGRPAPATVNNNGWRVFVPAFATVRQWVFYGVPVLVATSVSAKKYLDMGRNPLREVSFYTDLIATHIGLLVAVNALGTAGSNPGLVQTVFRELILGSASGVLMFLAVDDLLQNLRFLHTAALPDERLRSLVTSWVPYSTSNLAVLLASSKLLDLLLARASPWTAVLGHALWKGFQGYFYHSASYAIWWRYMLYRNMSFHEVLTMTEPDDFKLWLRNDLCAAPDSELERRACAAVAGKGDPLAGAGTDRPLVALELEELSVVQRLLRLYAPEEPGLDALMAAWMPRADALRAAELPGERR